MAVAAVFAIGLFFVVPVGVTSLIKGQLGSSVAFWAVEGVLRTAIFLGYLLLLSRVKDLKRVFEYHGAEHKVISCYEASDELTPERARLYSRFHPRCGTSFLLVVMIMAIFVFAPVGLPAWWILVLTRIVGVPLIAGAVVRGDQVGRPQPPAGWVRAIMYPGMQLQRLTTAEPDLDQLAVSIASLKAVLAEQEHRGLARGPCRARSRSVGFVPASLPGGTRVRVVIVGAGFGGLGGRDRAQRHGFDDVTVLERAPGIGGTWHYNDYPGVPATSRATCTRSHSRNAGTGRGCARRGPRSSGIWRTVARDVGRRSARGNAASTSSSCRWETAASSWTVSAARRANVGRGRGRDRDRAAASAFRPARPGIDEFGGAVFSLGRGGITRSTSGKRVAVIGTGASAVQFVPEVARQARRLYVFQRTGNWFLPRRNRAYPGGRARRDPLRARESRRFAGGWSTTTPRR